MLAVSIWALAVVIASGSGAVLDAGVACVGFDDHIDVESLLEGCCISTIPDLQGGVVVTPGDSCGDCVDVELKVSSFKAAKSLLSPPVDDSGFFLCSQCCNGGREPRSADVVNRMDQHSRSLSPLSTVILLT